MLLVAATTYSTCTVGSCIWKLVLHQMNFEIYGLRLPSACFQGPSIPAKVFMTTKWRSPLVWKPAPPGSNPSKTVRVKGSLEGRSSQDREVTCEIADHVCIRLLRLPWQNATEMYSLTLLEAGSPRSGCWQVWLLQRPLSSACRWLPSCCVLTGPFLLFEHFLCLFLFL